MTDVFVKRAGLDEKRALEHFGEVKVLGYDDGRLILERIQPGTSLADLADDDLALAHLCDVATRLHARGMPDGSWRTVEDWGRAFDQHPEFERAAEMYAALAASQTKRCLLHGDLHYHNVLLDQHRGWLAIDPKGVIGEPAYEFGAILRQETVRQSRRIDVICDRLGLERRRLIEWGYVQAMLAAVWCMEDGEDPAWALDAAHQLLIQTRT